jgi:starch synthase (maltosyl-transferring)
MKPLEPPTNSKGRVRPIIEGVTPKVDGGLYPCKREIGDRLVVEADVFVDGHDEVACELRWRHNDDARWSSVPMRHLGNDRWSANFTTERLGSYRYCIQASVDEYATWVRDLRARIASGQSIEVELAVGADVLDALAARARKADAPILTELRAELRRSAADKALDPGAALELASDPQVLTAARRCPDADTSLSSEPLFVTVDRTHARFSSWYELFPRSVGSGTLRDVEGVLPYVAQLGFDVLYLPPIHPIGTTNRKGRDGAQIATSTDPGSPWAIGAPQGGHTAIHPQLGELADLDRLVKEAADLGVELALDIAFQCSPDHPWVREHPEWFSTLPDGSIRFAENPPKRYEDIYPINFDTADWRALWAELAGVVRFWIDHGIRIFRVDNPHTKPLRFWEWMIASVKADYPDVVFLSEAFTRPKVMYSLAKAGFTQSYTYFAWRETKWDLEQYLAELHSPPVSDFFRPNLWPNTPDILTEQLQTGGRSAFMTRFVLAATLASSYGIYGPVFELQESRPRNTGSEEYLHSEKYEVRQWDLKDPKSLSPFITKVNAARRDNPALQHDGNLQFHAIENDQLIVYSRHFANNTVLIVVNLDPMYTQSGWVDLDLDVLEIDGSKPFRVRDILTGSEYDWKNRRNFVSLDPRRLPAHIFEVRQSA